MGFHKDAGFVLNSALLSTNPNSESHSIIASKSGIILSYRVLVQTKRGYCLFELAQPESA